MAERWRKLNKSLEVDAELASSMVRRLMLNIERSVSWSYRFNDKAAVELSKEFCYPNYSDLVGKNNKENIFITYGMEFSYQKADLLLIGEYRWNGLVIAKSKPLGVKDSVGWIVNLDPDYKPVDAFDMGEKQVRYRETDEFGQRYIEYNTRFRPFRGVKKEFIKPLIEVLYQKEGMVPITKTSNIFNLHENNIIYRPKGGRPLKCVKCGRVVTYEISRKLDCFPVSGRYCLCCISSIAKNSRV